MEKKSIDIVVFGAPNCGKSTFSNAIVNSEVCVVSDRPHTTREPTLAIYTKDNIQVVFIDTPGVSTHLKKDETKLASLAKKSINSADLCLFIFDGSKKPPIHIVDFAGYIEKPKIAFINKIDKEFSKGKLLPFTDYLKSTFDHIFYGSALNNIGLTELLDFMIQYAKEKEWKFLDTQNTTREIEQLINDRTKEVIFDLMEDEIPYSVDVVLEKIEDKDDGSVLIYQNIIVKESYKHIFLGKIKIISISARKKIEKMLKLKVHLYIKIKCKKK